MRRRLVQQTSDLIKAVHEHWVLTGVDIDTADEMADELADHLRSAEEDGKDPALVVGEDVRAFADGWAAPVADRTKPWEQAKLFVIGAVAAALGFLGAQVLLGWSTELTVRPLSTGLLSIVLGFVALVILGPAISRLSPGGGLRSNTFVVVRVGVPLALLIGGWIWASTAYEEELTFAIPSWLAVVAGVFAFGLIVMPLITLLPAVDRTDGWAKRILAIVDKFV